MDVRQSQPGSSANSALPREGDVLDGRYQLETLIGLGGMGAVFAATDLEVGCPVAVKVLLPAEAESVESVRRFLREGKAAQVLESPHVARVYGTGQLPSGIPYLVLELLDGESLDRLIRRHSPLPIPTAVDLMLQICEGVAAAHARGIVHRDLKPSNLHTSSTADGTTLVKVLDFGIAKATQRLDPNTDALSLTETSASMGSPQYMSPEQLRSAKSVDARADIWSLGVILHKLLTGKPAFVADNLGAQFAAILSEAPTPVRSHRPEIPEELETTIFCCLEKHLEHRFQDVGQLAEALGPFADAAGKERIGRIRAMLDARGASAPSRPIPSASGKTMPDGALHDAAPTRTWRKRDEDTTLRSWDTQTVDASPRGRGRWVLLGAALGLSGLAFGAWAWLRPLDGHPSPTAASSGREDPAAESSASAPDTVAISLRLEPADADVWLDGARAPQNPIRLSRSDQVHEVVVRAPGYAPERHEVRADRDAELVVELSADEAASQSEPTRPRPGSLGRPTPRPSSKPTVQPKGPWSDDL